MRTALLLALVAGLALTSLAPLASADPPKPLPDCIGRCGCDNFIWSDGDLARGDLPGYRFRACE
jgi:hypothetical protein